MTTPLAHRGALSFAGAVLAGGVSASLFAVALNHGDSLAFFIIYLAAVPLFIAGLGAGALAGLIASAAGFAGLLLIEPSNYAVLYAFIYAAPAMALTALAMRYRTGADGQIYWYPEGHLLTAITLYPCILFILVSAGASGHEGGLLGLTTQFLGEATESMKTQMDADVAIQFTTMMDKIIKFLPSLMGSSWIFISMISMIAAQSVLQRQGWNLRPGFTLRDLHLPSWLIYVIAITGLAGMAAPAPYDYIGGNLAIILGLPFFFVGLAVVHAWAERQKATTAILIFFYVVISIFPFLAFVVVLLGVVDEWAHFRQRFNQQPKST